MRISGARLSSLTAVCFALVLPSLAAPAGAETLHVNGWELEVRLTSEKPTIMVGEPVYLSYEIVNHSDDDLQILIGGDYRNRLGRPGRFTIEVSTNQGQPVPVPDVGLSMGGLVGPREIPSGGRYIKRLLLPNWAEITQPGQYTVLCKRTLNLDLHTTGRYDRDRNTIDVDTAVSTRLRVEPADPKKMAQIIADLGATLLAGDHQEAESAARALLYVQDSRVIPYFERAYETGQSTLIWYSVRAMGQFVDDGALDLLEKAAVASADDVRYTTTPELAAQAAARIRHAASFALATSPHPRARALLLSMRDDPDPGVRITLLQAFGKTKSDEALELLREMSTDPDDSVRFEARRLLEALQ